MKTPIFQCNGLVQVVDQQLVLRSVHRVTDVMFIVPRTEYSWDDLGQGLACELYEKR